MIWKKDRHLQDDEDLPMTAMIDIVFQLLIFFLLSAKFIALEGNLASYLPKDKGLDSTVVPLDPVNVALDLIWDEQQGRVRCRTMDYRRDDGTRIPLYEFPTIPGKMFEYGPPGNSHTVDIEYTVPDFKEIEGYLRDRKAGYEDPRGTGLPVTVNFDDEVPVQMVTTLLDICTRQGIKDFTITAREMD